jgi:arsenite methyltransferase
MSTTADVLRDEIKARYAEAALAVAAGNAGSCGSGSCCGGADDANFGADLYTDEERAGLPGTAAASSLGCGNPVRVAHLEEGDVVLDLGSGGGLDVILAAQRVSPSGVAYGLDMTDEMHALARRNAREAGVSNAHFLRGRIEEIPLASESVDVVISNCVINLSTEKAAVFTEIARVLAPEGRLGVTDVVAEDRLSPEERAERGGWVGCIAGALSVSEYTAGLEAAGLVDVEVEFTHEVADGLHGAIVRGRKPAGSLLSEPVAARAGCC